MYQKINDKIVKKIQTIIEGNYEISILGTLGQEGYPFLSKIQPMYDNNKIYILISDLSEHTQNIISNKKVSFYFSMKEINNTKLNNPRLTLNGEISKLELNKNNSKYIDLLKNYQKIEKGSKMWGMFSDFNFYLFTPYRALFIEGFGKAYQKIYPTDF
jgi:putative heme iron utilization protein